MSDNRLKLQALRIPTGWTVIQNEFYEIEPDVINNNNLLWGGFTEDMLQIQHNHKRILIDLGWYPDMDPSGEFRLVLVKNEDWENPLEVFKSNNKIEVVEKIEYLLDTAYNR